jgi:hypothetical protein
VLPFGLMNALEAVDANGYRRSVARPHRRGVWSHTDRDLPIRTHGVDFDSWHVIGRVLQAGAAAQARFAQTRSSCMWRRCETATCRPALSCRVEALRLPRRAHRRKPAFRPGSSSSASRPQPHRVDGGSWRTDRRKTARGVTVIIPRR